MLGELLAWDDPDGFVRVATARGEVVLALADILMGKPVPPAPAPRSRRGRPSPSLAELHDLMADGWQPLEREDYGGWRLRAAEGFTGRANSVLPLGDPPAPLALAVDHAESWYAARDLPGRFCVLWPLGSGPDEPAYGDDPLEAELVRRGYRLDYPSLVMTRALEAPSPSRRRPASRSSLAAEPDEGFLTLYRYRGEDLPPVAARLLMSAPAQAFASVRSDDSAAHAGHRAGGQRARLVRRHRRRGRRGPSPPRAGSGGDGSAAPVGGRAR